MVAVGKSKEDDNEILVEISGLMDKFKGLAPDELPLSLSPLHDIHNQIDFT